MVTVDDFGKHETAWCPGCGNFSILEAVKNALVASNLAPYEVLFVSGHRAGSQSPSLFERKRL